MRKQARKKPDVLPNGRERLRATIEASVDCIISIDAQSTILEFNAAAERTFGYSRDEVLGKSLTETIIPLSLRDAHLRGMTALLKGGESKLLGRRVEMPAMRADGSEFPVELTITRITSEIFTAYLRDITERKRAEEELSNSLALLRAITEGTTDAVFAKDRQGRYIIANTATAQFVDKSSDEVIGLDDTALFSPETAERIMERDRSVLASGETRTDEDVGTTAEGVFHVYLTTKGPLRDSSGAINGVFGIARDITNRKRAEEALRQADDRSRLVIDAIPTMAWRLRPDGAVDFVNQRWLEYTGLCLPDALGDSTRIVHPGDLPSAVEKWQPAMAAGTPHEDEIRFRRADGKYRWFLVRISPLRDAAGNIVNWYGAAVDIEDRKQAEMRTRTLIDAIPHQIWSGPADGTLDYCNERWRSYMGLEQEELRGSGWQSMLHPDDRERVLKAWQEAVSKGTPYEQEERHRGADGSYRWFTARGVPMRNAEGRIVRWYGTNTDIEARKQAEEALNAQELRYTTLMETSTDSIYVLDAEGNLLEANAAFLRQRGYTAAEVKGLNVADWDARWTRAQLQKRLRKLVGSSAVFETRHRCKDGTLFDVEVNAASVQVGGEQLFFCVTRDVTERKKAERASKDSETRFRQLVENLNEVFWINDLDGSSVYVSPAYERIWGRSCESLYADPKSWRDAIHPEDGPRMEATFAADPALTEDNTYRIIRPDGSVRWIHDRGCPVRDEAGKLIRIAGIAEDITERKQNEEHLREYEKAVEGLEEMIVVVDRDYRYLLANRAFLNFRGLKRGQLIGRLAAEVLGPEAFAEVAPKLGECLTGRTIQYEMRYRFPDNSERDLLVSYLPIEGSGGIDRVACVLHDITERKQAEDRLRRSEEKFKALFQLAPVGIAFLDSRANIVDCNPALERITRLSREELLGAAWQQRTFLNGDGSVRLPGERVSERAVTEKRLVTGVETGALMESGEIVWAEVTVAPLFLPDASAVVITQDITERKRAAKELEEANGQLRILSRQLFHIQEEERRHLARELHDEIGQTLTAAKINLKIIAPEVPAEVTGRLDDSVQLLDRLLRQVRELSLDLRPPLLDELGLVPTLRWLVDQQAQRAGLRVTFSANVDGIEIDPGVQTTCFRVAQEAITNIIRHSGAKNVGVEVRCEAERLTLSVRDDGAGFTPALIQQRNPQDFSLGLVSMKERALLVCGGFEVQSAPGQGTEIRAWFPLPRGEPSSATETRSTSCNDQIH